MLDLDSRFLGSMPPPSIAGLLQSSSSSNADLPPNDYAVHHLQSVLHELQEDLDISWLQEWFMLKEALYLEEIVALK